MARFSPHFEAMTRGGAVDTGTPGSRTPDTPTPTPITPVKTPVSVDHETPDVTLTVTPTACSPRRKEKEGQTGSRSREKLKTAIQAVDYLKLDEHGQPVKEQERVSYQNMIVRYGYWKNVRVQVVAYFVLTMLVTIYKGYSDEILRMTGTVRVSTGQHIHCCCNASLEQRSLDNIKEMFHMDGITKNLTLAVLILMGGLSPVLERFIGRRKMLYAMLGAAVPAAAILSLGHLSFTQQLSHFILSVSALTIVNVNVSNLIEMLPYETRYLAPFCYWFPMNFSCTIAVLHFRAGFLMPTLGIYSICANLIGIIIVRFFIKDSICHLNIRNDVKAIEEILQKEEYQLHVHKREGSRKFHNSIAKKIFEDIVFLDQDELKLSEFLKQLYKSFAMIEIFLVFFQSISAGIHDFENERFTESRFYEASELAADRMLGFLVASVLLFVLRKAHRSRVICCSFAVILLISAARHVVIGFDMKNHCPAIAISMVNFNMFSILLSVLSNALCICIKFTIVLHFLETSPSILRPMTLILVYLPVKITVDMMKKYYTKRNLDSRGSSIVKVLIPIYAYHLAIIIITMLRTRSKLPFSLYLFDLMPQSDSDREENHGSHEKIIRPMLEVSALPLASTEREKQEIKDQKPEEKQSISQASRVRDEQEKSKWSVMRIFKSN